MKRILAVALLLLSFASAAFADGGVDRQSRGRPSQAKRVLSCWPTEGVDRQLEMPPSRPKGPSRSSRIILESRGQMR